MPLIEAGDECCPQHRDVRPPERPTWIPDSRQGFSPGAKQQDTQQAVPENVAALAKIKVHNFEACMAQAEEEMQERIQNTAGVVGGKIGARFKSNDNQPKDRSDPGFQELVTVRAQEGSDFANNEVFLAGGTLGGVS